MFLNDSNLEQPVPSAELGSNITTLANTTAKMLNSSKWLFEDDVIKNFRWVVCHTFPGERAWSMSAVVSLHTWLD